LDTLRIEYRPTYKDKVCFTLIHQFLAPATNGFFVLFAALVFVMEHRRQTATISLRTAIIVYVLMWLAQILYVSVLSLTRRRDPLLSEHVMTLQDDGVLDATEFGKWHIFWRGIQKVALRPGFVAIYIGSGLAFLIPKRAFASHEVETTFITIVKARVNQARSAQRDQATN
jgi:YcxB-like protein